MISKFLMGQVLYEFFIVCPGLFNVLTCICFAHARSLQVLVWDRLGLASEESVKQRTG